MFTNVVEVLDMQEVDGQITCRVDRFDVKANPGESVVVSWNSIEPPEGFCSVGGGVAFVKPVDNEISLEKVLSAPDRLGNGRFCWRDTMHGVSMIIIVVLPNGYVVKDLDDLLPSPICFKVFNQRMAFYWDLGETTTVKWKISRIGNMNLARLVERLNREADLRHPMQHAILIDPRKYVGADNSQDLNSPNGAMKNKPDLPVTWDKILVVAMTSVVVLAVIYAALAYKEIPARNFILLRILLVAAMGVIGGVMTGFLVVDLSFRGAMIRAGGGLALAVISYFFTPAVIPNDLDAPPKKLVEHRNDEVLDSHPLNSTNQ